MSKKAFQEYLDLCTDALVQTAAKEKTNYQTINKCYYTYIVLNSLNVSETKIERITAESLKGGHGILEKRRIPTKANGAGQSIYSMSVKEYLEKNFRYDSVFEFAENKIEYLSHNGTFSKSDIEYISVFFDALAKGENTVSFWTTMIKELFEAIQKDYLSAGSSLGKSYSLYMMAEISAFFVEFNDIFNGVTGQIDDAFYTAAASLYFKLFLITAIDEKIVNAAGAFRISPISVLAAEDFRRCQNTPVLINSSFSSTNKETVDKLVEMIKALISKTAEISPDKMDPNAFHVLFGDCFFHIANNFWCQENAIFPLLARKDKDAMIFKRIFSRMASIYHERKWSIPGDMYRLDRSYASFCALSSLSDDLQNDVDPIAFDLYSKTTSGQFWIKRFLQGDPIRTMKEINEGGKDANSYAKNRNFFIKATNEELITAMDRGHLYAVFTEKNQRKAIVGFAIMTVDTNTTDPQNKTPYNGGKMKAALEKINISEKNYGVLNTVIIDQDYYGFGLQHVLTLLLIRMCRGKKDYIVATVSKKNKYSYHNFMKCCFTDIDKDNELSGSVIYNIDGKKYPRHVVLLKTNESLRYHRRLNYSNFMFYVKLFHEISNNNYDYYNGKNCQNYVSQCLIAAGWGFDNDFYPGSLPFVNVSEFKNYAVQNGIEYCDGFDDIAQGDLLITDDGGHIMVVQAVMTENDETVIYAAGNTNNRDMFIVAHQLITGYLKTSLLF